MLRIELYEIAGAPGKSGPPALGYRLIARRTEMRRAFCVQPHGNGYDLNPSYSCQ